MQTVYARDAEGNERLLALVRRDDRKAFVCPIEKYVPDDEQASLEFAIGFPIADVRDGRSIPDSDAASSHTMSPTSARPPRR